MVQMSKTIRAFGLALLVVVVASAARGLASADSGRPTLRGEGAAVISGYTVSSLQFKLGEDPALIDLVEFDLDAPARVVLVSFQALSARAFRCVNPAATHWHCALEQVLTGDADEIRITATG